MTNEKFLYVYKLLEALNGWYNPRPGFDQNAPLSPHALLLETDETVKEAVGKAWEMVQSPNS